MVTGENSHGGKRDEVMVSLEINGDKCGAWCVFLCCPKRLKYCTVLDLSRGWVVNPHPLMPLDPSKFVLTPENIIEIIQKYIADPPLVFPQIEYWYCTDSPHRTFSVH